MNQELYDVFLSYRHKPLDGVITQQTFNILESFRLPKALRDQGYHGAGESDSDRRSCNLHAGPGESGGSRISEGSAPLLRFPAEEKQRDSRRECRFLEK